MYNLKFESEISERGILKQTSPKVKVPTFYLPSLQFVVPDGW